MLLFIICCNFTAILAQDFKTGIQQIELNTYLRQPIANSLKLKEQFFEKFDENNVEKSNAASAITTYDNQYFFNYQKVNQQTGNGIAHKKIMDIYATPLGITNSLSGMKTPQIMQPQVGLFFPITSKKSADLIDAIASGAKLTKADASRIMNPGKSHWGVDVNFSNYNFTPQHLLDGYEQQVSSFAVTENTRKNWSLNSFVIGPAWQTTGTIFDVTLSAGPSLTIVQPAQFRQGDPVQNVLYQNYQVPANFNKQLWGAQGNVRLNWHPFQSFPLGFYLQAGYLWLPSNSFTVSQRDISKVNFNATPASIQTQLSNPQIAPFIEKTYTTPTQFFNTHVGLNFTINKQLNKPNSSYQQPNQVAVEPETKNVVKNKPEKVKTNNNQFIQFTNPNQESQQQENNFRIVLDAPKNNAVYKKQGAMPVFQWHVEGKAPEGAQYTIQIMQVNDRGEVMNAVAQSTVMPNQPYQLPANQINQMREAQTTSFYSWKVIETTTGTTSRNSSYSVQGASCGTIYDSMHIACNGWDPKTGLPTYSVTLCLRNEPTNNTAGCNATYTGIVSNSGGTISSINTLPLTITPNQTGCISFTYSPANLSQTNVSFTINGTWSDPLNNTVNILSQDSLPTCICHDCDQVRIQVGGQPQVNQQANDPHLYNISGMLSANVPIYAVEISVHSFSFTANPGGCAYVDSVEHDGMIVGNGTTINNTTAGLVFGNAPVGNANVFKDLKWIASSPISAGTMVPINLVVGLPAPANGNNASCCAINYTICFTIRVYYNSCRYCEKTVCLQLSNQ
ncbi:hypothetical protein [Hydrotalea sandarakina]|nr:hypothetical protein [Hydrotalea sandarakina]